ncbi:MAG: hypothetical protein R3A80_13145 [Bdellovibrionota bacterium]
MNKPELLFLWGLSFMCTAQLNAADKTGDFAHCSLANQQLKMLNDYMESELRIRASQFLIQDIEELRPMIIKNTTGLPDRLIQLCFDIKRRAFKTTFVKGGPALYGSFEFLMAAGKYFFYEQEYSIAHDALEAAVKLRPNLFDPNYYALQAWTFTQVTAEKPVPTAAYDRKVKSYVENLLKTKDIKPDQKRIVLGFLAGAEQKASQIYTARTLMNRSLALNPQDLKMRLQLGLLEEKAGRFAEAKKVYEEAIALKIIDPVTENAIYKNLLRLYGILGEKDKQKLTAQRALALHPKDPYFKKLSNKVDAQRAPASANK